MARALACPDKFRGTLTGAEAAARLARGLRTAGFDEVRELPLADGGEGTLDTLLAARGGSLRPARVTGPLGEPVDASWALLPDGTAIVEMARASGLALVAGRNDALRATTRGTGELIAAAARSGARRIIVAVGGSATTDGGLAAVQALGWSLAGLDVTVACDVRARFRDAPRIFGPQKGASDAQVALLSRRLERLAQQYRERTGVEVTELLTFLERETGRVRLDVLDPSWIIFGGGFCRDSLRVFSSRALDLVASLAILGSSTFDG